MTMELLVSGRMILSWQWEAILQCVWLIKQSFLPVSIRNFELLYAFSDAFAVAIYEKATETWFGIGLPADSLVRSLSSVVYQGKEYLLLAGDFNVTVGTETVNSIGFYDLQERLWVPIQYFPLTSNINSVFVNTTGSMFLTGTFVSKLQK